MFPTVPVSIVIALLLVLCGCDGTGTRTMSDVIVEPSPSCTLTCLLSWSTSHEALPAVEFGEGTMQSRIEGTERGTDHELLVVGMHHGATYTLQAVSVFDDGEELRSEDQVFVPGEPPDPIVTPQLDVLDESRATDGWTLTNISTGLAGPVLPVILDRNGEVVWYHHYREGELGFAGQVAQLVDDYHIMVGPAVPAEQPVVEIDLRGQVHWEGPIQSVNVLGDGQLHHVLERLDNGHTMLIAFEEGDEVLGDEVLEFDGAGELVWSWGTLDHLDPHPERIHANALHVDVDADVLYLNSYEQSVAWKIDRDTGTILWTLGAGGDFAPDPDAAEPWFNSAHGLKVLPDNHILFYDNGDPERGYTRVIELALDETTMESTLVWEYPGELADDPWFAYSWGDADRLDNGNTLVNAGSGPLSPDEEQSRIFEVTPGGEVVWQVWWPLEPQKLGSFEAERIPALATAL